jgi:hypothetical protein
MDTAGSNAAAELATLRKEERSISVRRTRLHARIDFLRAGGNPDQSSETLAELERQEQEISRQRRELHERIARLEAELGAGGRAA